MMENEFYEGYLTALKWYDADNLPKERLSVLTKHEYEGQIIYDVSFVLKGKWMTRYNKPIAYRYIYDED